MAYDDKNPKVEVESLKRRFPKRGIDPTIPEGIRAMLREKEQDALTPSSKYAKGGNVNMKKRKFADGGGIPATRQDPANSNIVPTNTVVGKSPEEAQIDFAKATSGLHQGQERPSISPSQAQAMIGPATSDTTPSMAVSPNRRFRPPGRLNKIYREYAKGGTVSSASSRGDGCAQRGKTKGKVI